MHHKHQTQTFVYRVKVRATWHRQCGLWMKYIVDQFRCPKEHCKQRRLLENWITSTHKYIPGHVTRTGHYLVVVQKSTTRKVASVARQFTANTYIAFTSLETIDRANVVQSAARNVGTRGSVRTGHHPAWSKGNCVHFVGGVGIPYYQLAILRRWHKISDMVTREITIRPSLRIISNVNTYLESEPQCIA